MRAPVYNCLQIDCALAVVSLTTAIQEHQKLFKEPPITLYIPIGEFFKALELVEGSDLNVVAMYALGDEMWFVQSLQGYRTFNGPDALKRYFGVNLLILNK